MTFNNIWFFSFGKRFIWIFIFTFSIINFLIQRTLSFLFFFFEGTVCGGWVVVGRGEGWERFSDGVGNFFFCFGRERGRRASHDYRGTLVINCCLIFWSREGKLEEVRKKALFWWRRDWDSGHVSGRDSSYNFCFIIYSMKKKIYESYSILYFSYNFLYYFFCFIYMSLSKYPNKYNNYEQKKEKNETYALASWIFLFNFRFFSEIFKK